MVLLTDGIRHTNKRSDIVQMVIDLYKAGYTLRGIRKQVMLRTKDFPLEKREQMLSTITIKKILDINNLLPDDDG